MKTPYYFHGIMRLKDEGKISDYLRHLHALTKKELMQFAFFLVGRGAMAEEVLEDYVRPEYFEKGGKYERVYCRKGEGNRPAFLHAVGAALRFLSFNDIKLSTRQA